MKIVGLIIFILFVIYFLVTFVIFLIATNKKIYKLLKGPDKAFEKAIKEFEPRIISGGKWVDNQEKEDVYIKSKDGLKLHGIFLPNKKNNKIIILVHGQGSEPRRDVYPSAHEYYDMGYALLIVDLRACGESEGHTYTYGYHEHEDLSLWVNYIYKKYKNSKIILGGVSLGATSALMVPNINKHVDAVVADSGFRNAYKELSHVLSYFFHLPGNMIMPMVNVYCKWFYHINLKWVDTVESLKNVRIPILFIHGIDDEFVLIDNTIENYNSYKGHKTKVFINFCQHGMGYLVNRKQYIDSIEKFLRKV